MQDNKNGQTPTPNDSAAPITVNVQYLKDASFENPHPVKSFQESTEGPEISVGIDVRVDRLADQTYEVALHIAAEALRNSEKMFVCEVEYAGIFTLGNLPAEAIQPVLMIECPRILFPFARQVIANLTRDGGFPALSLNPIDFVAMYQQQMQKDQENAPSQSNA